MFVLAETMYLCRTLGELLRMHSGCFCYRSNNVWFWKEPGLVSFADTKCQKCQKMALTTPPFPFFQCIQSSFNMCECVWWSKLMKQRTPTACHSLKKLFCSEPRPKSWWQKKAIEQKQKDLGNDQNPWRKYPKNRNWHWSRGPTNVFSLRFSMKAVATYRFHQGIPCCLLWWFLIETERTMVVTITVPYAADCWSPKFGVLQIEKLEATAAKDGNDIMWETAKHRPTTPNDLPSPWVPGCYALIHWFDAENSQAIDWWSSSEIPPFALMFYPYFWPILLVRFT